MHRSKSKKGTTTELAAIAEEQIHEEERESSERHYMKTFRMVAALTHAFSQPLVKAPKPGDEADDEGGKGNSEVQQVQAKGLPTDMCYQLAHILAWDRQAELIENVDTKQTQTILQLKIQELGRNLLAYRKKLKTRRAKFQRRKLKRLKLSLEQRGNPGTIKPTRESHIIKNFATYQEFLDISSATSSSNSNSNSSSDADTESDESESESESESKSSESFESSESKFDSSQYESSESSRSESESSESESDSATSESESSASESQYDHDCKLPVAKDNEVYAKSQGIDQDVTLSLNSAKATYQQDAMTECKSDSKPLASEDDKIRAKSRSIDQGSAMSLNSTKGMYQRDAIRFEQEIGRLILRLWRLVDTERAGELNMNTYISFMKKVHFVLYAERASSRAEYLIIKDWHGDSSGRSQMRKSEFIGSIFELVDLWTEKIDADEYQNFLADLIECLSFTAIRSPSGADVEHSIEMRDEKSLISMVELRWRRISGLGTQLARGARVRVFDGRASDIQGGYWWQSIRSSRAGRVVHYDPATETYKVECSGLTGTTCDEIHRCNIHVTSEVPVFNSITVGARVVYHQVVSASHSSGCSRQVKGTVILMRMDGTLDLATQGSTTRVAYHRGVPKSYVSKEEEIHAWDTKVLKNLPSFKNMCSQLMRLSQPRLVSPSRKGIYKRNNQGLHSITKIPLPIKEIGSLSALRKIARNTLELQKETPNLCHQPHLSLPSFSPLRIRNKREAVDLMEISPFIWHSPFAMPTTPLTATPIAVSQVHLSHTPTPLYPNWAGKAMSTKTIPPFCLPAKECGLFFATLGNNHIVCEEQHKFKALDQLIDANTSTRKYAIK